MKGSLLRELRWIGYKKEIVSFEPLCAAHEMLLLAASSDPLWHAHPRTAIGDFDGEIEINIAGNSVSSSVLPMLDLHKSSEEDSSYVGTERTPIAKLDTVIPAYLSSDSRFFLKIDTQGFEWQVLDGATETLKNTQGVLCELSLEPLYEGQRPWREMIDRLEAAGFTLWAIQKGFTDKKNGRSMQIDAIFLRLEKGLVSEHIMLIVTLTTCHNRRDCTLAALSDLHCQELPEGISLHHVIVDDGSIDGTTEAIRLQFPDVEIVKGNGNCYWAGGMRLGWESTVRNRAFDYLLVYNDDVRFFTSAIKELLETRGPLQNTDNGPHVIVGSFKSSDGKVTTYGGRLRSSWWHPLKFALIVEPNGAIQKADTLNMNGALISAAALPTVGFLSDYFIHSGADFEYGLKLTKAGGAIYVAGQHIGICDLNDAMKPPEELSLTLKQRMRLLADIKREPFNQRFQYYRRHGGFLWPLLWISPYITVWIRYVWFSLLRMFGTCRAKSGIQ